MDEHGGAGEAGEPSVVGAGGSSSDAGSVGAGAVDATGGQGGAAGARSSGSGNGSDQVGGAGSGNAYLGGAGGAAGSTDGGARDAQAGAGGLGGEPAVESSAFGFVFDKVIMPTSNAEALAVGFDLNADTSPDNQFGRAMSQLTAMGFFVNPALNAAVQKGALLMLARIEAMSLSNTEGASFATYFGGDPIPEPCSAINDCGKHLSGAGAFTVADDTPNGSPCTGVIAQSVYHGKGGSLPMRLMFGIERADVVLRDARVELSMLSEDGFSSSRVGGAIADEDVETAIYPAVHKTIVSDVALGCSGSPPPTCGCQPNAKGAVFIGTLDTNHDCTVSLEEVKANDTIRGLFTLDIDRDGDQTNDALSCAFTVGGKKAVFDVP